MDRESPGLAREKKTVEAMVYIACSGRHATENGLCEGCQALLAYALDRLNKCPFQESKPTCADCPIHCYRPDMQEEIRSVMRYAGPRMLFRHPLLALHHLIDGLRKPPDSVIAGERRMRDTQDQTYYRKDSEP